MDKTPFVKLLEIAQKNGIFEKNEEMKRHLDLFDGDLKRLAHAMLENDITAALFDHKFMESIFGGTFERAMREAVMIDDWQERLNYVASEAENYELPTS